MIRKLVKWAVLLGVFWGIFLYYAPKAQRPRIRPTPTATDTASAISSQTTVVAPQAASPAAESPNGSGPPENK